MFKDIEPGSCVGGAAMPLADGTQLALQVLIFPEAMRGTGEGQRPWDLQPQSTMTNATVADLAAASSTVPAGAPVVIFKPGKQDEAALLVSGANVLITAQERGGKPTAVPIVVRRNGFAPPM